MRNAVAEAQALDRLLSSGAADPKIVFGFYYTVRIRDRAVAERILRDTTNYVGLFARNRRRLKELDEWLVGTAPFSYPSVR